MNSQEIQQAYAKLIINDQSFSEDTNKQEEQNATNQYNYPTQNATQPNTQHPQYQPYPIQQYQINPPIYSNQVNPDPTQLIAHSNEGGINDPNNRFALIITSIWALQMWTDYCILAFLHLTRLPSIIYLISIVISIVIPLYAYRFKEPPSKETQIILFAIQVLTSSFSQMGYFFVLDWLFGEHHIYDMLLFEAFQEAVMIAGFISIFVYKKPNGIFISIISPLIIIVAMVIMLSFYGNVSRTYHFIPVTAFVCPILSFLLVFALQSVYNGSNKRIKKDQILIAFLQFKVFFYFPCIKE